MVRLARGQDFVGCWDGDGTVFVYGGLHMITHRQKEMKRVSYCEVKHPSATANSSSQQHDLLDFHNGTHDTHVGQCTRVTASLLPTLQLCHMLYLSDV